MDPLSAWPLTGEYFRRKGLDPTSLMDLLRLDWATLHEARQVAEGELEEAGLRGIAARVLGVAELGDTAIADFASPAPLLWHLPCALGLAEAFYSIGLPRVGPKPVDSLLAYLKEDVLHDGSQGDAKTGMACALVPLLFLDTAIEFRELCKALSAADQQEPDSLYIISKTSVTPSDLTKLLPIFEAMGLISESTVSKNILRQFHEDGNGDQLLNPIYLESTQEAIEILHGRKEYQDAIKALEALEYWISDWTFAVDQDDPWERGAVEAFRRAELWVWIHDTYAQIYDEMGDLASAEKYKQVDRLDLIIIHLKEYAEWNPLPEGVPDPLNLQVEDDIVLLAKSLAVVPARLVRLGTTTEVAVEPGLVESEARKVIDELSLALPILQSLFPMVATNQQAIVQLGERQQRHIETTERIAGEVRQMSELLLDTLIKVTAAMDSLTDDAFRQARDGILHGWRQTHSQREREAAERVLREKVGNGGWESLLAESREDLLFYQLMDESGREGTVRFLAIALCVALERELRAALRRDGEAEPGVTLENLIGNATADGRAPRVQGAASRIRTARISGFDGIRNRAAHPDKVTPADVAALEAVLFEKEGDKGVLGLLATHQRQAPPA